MSIIVIHFLLKIIKLINTTQAELFFWEKLFTFKLIDKLNKIVSK